MKLSAWKAEWLEENLGQKRILTKLYNILDARYEFPFLY
jgi:hypothetical protein